MGTVCTQNSFLEKRKEKKKKMRSRYIKENGDDQQIFL
jgi:hypothetical protein